MDRVKRGAYTGRLQPIAAAADHSSTTLPLFQEQEQITSTTTTTTVLEVAETAALTTASATVLAADITTTSTSTTIVQQSQKEDAVMAMAAPSTPLVRIHSECFTGEIGHSARCDCGEQLDEAIRRMKEEGAGVVVYLRQEGRGIGLGEKIK
jgi:GTP cyclohydrolase II